MYIKSLTPLSIRYIFSYPALTWPWAPSGFQYQFQLPGENLALWPFFFVWLVPGIDPPDRLTALWAVCLDPTLPPLSCRPLFGHLNNGIDQWNYFYVALATSSYPGDSVILDPVKGPSISCRSPACMHACMQGLQFQLNRRQVRSGFRLHHASQEWRAAKPFTLQNCGSCTILPQQPKSADCCSTDHWFSNTFWLAQSQRTLTQGAGLIRADQHDQQNRKRSYSTTIIPTVPKL